MIQTGGHPCSLGFGDFAHLGEISARILRCEIEHLLDDARDRFPVAIRNGEETEIIPFPEEGVGRP